MHSRNAVVLLSALATLLLLGLLFDRSAPKSTEDQVLVRASLDTPTPFSFHALTSASAAIERAEGLYPGSPPSASTPVARLKSRLDAVSWRARATPESGTYDSTELAKPAWIVAIPGGSLTACDLAPLEIEIGSMGKACDDSTTLYGVYYILNAENAVPITEGELTAAKVATLQAMSNSSFTITPTTPEPIPGTVVSTPYASPPTIVTLTPVP